MPATKRDSLNMERSRQRYNKTIQIEPIEPARFQLSSGCLVVVIYSAAVFQTAAGQNGCYASKSKCDRLMHSEELFTRGRK
jgi:hypothetical protein